LNICTAGDGQVVDGRLDRREEALQKLDRRRKDFSHLAEAALPAADMGLFKSSKVPSRW
jgi:hypothetical protein